VDKSRGALTRRQFLIKSSAVTMTFASAAGRSMNSAIAPEEDPQLATLRNTFTQPSLITRPLTRWWWFGGATTPDEITRELTLMRDAGLGGVELNPVYPLEIDDRQRGIRNTRYFSPEWFDLLRHTVKETRRLGLQFDFTLGSGWPYGGPFIPVELAARKLQVVTKDVVGPSELVWDLGMEFPAGARNLPAVAIPLLPSQSLDIARSQVLAGDATQGWKLPSGTWRVMVFADSPTMMQVKRPTIGMEGNVLDHFSREALDLFLKSVGTRTVEELKELGLPPFHSIFCDSLEVQGADWTGNFLEEFRKRRNYDLTPYLPALWQDAGALTPAIRHDYHQTLSDLILENFFRPLSEWSKQHGMTARLQAHGTMGDVMRAYGFAHIPEGESYGPAKGYQVSIAHRRMASSAAHIYQKPIVSAESYTWLSNPLFTTTLEMMKLATDAQFLDGINQIVNHGFPYSPPQAGQPGWTFYASTLINHNNLWWRHYPQLARYIQRVSGMLQQGVSVNSVAVYLPLADVYSKFGAGSLQMNDALEAHMGDELVTGLRRAGYDFDFINDDALQRITKVEHGRLVAGTGVYSAVIVAETRYMPVESLARLADFVKTGGLLLFVNQSPSESPGLPDQEAGTRRLRATLNDLWGNTVRREGEFISSGKGLVHVARGIPEVLGAIREHICPDFAIVQAGDSSDVARNLAMENVGFVHRGVPDMDSYFLSNMSKFIQVIRAQFAVGHKVPQRWNPETSAMEETLVYNFAESSFTKESVTEVSLRLDPLESCFVVFGASAERPLITRTNWRGPLRIEEGRGKVQVEGLVAQNGEYFLEGPLGKTHRFSVKGAPAPLPLTGPWRLTFDDGETVDLSGLKSWTDLPDRRNYSGWATYETDIELKDPGKDVEWVLDLGEVRETAEATLNGVPIGIAWKGLRRLKCGDVLKAGVNRLKVEVANLWINKVGSLPPRDLSALAETYGVRWSTASTNLPPLVLPSGLLGPVMLVPSRHWTERF
jgi:hypothetical protein